MPARIRNGPGPDRRTAGLRFINGDMRRDLTLVLSCASGTLSCYARSAFGATAENQISGGAEMTKKSFPLSRVYRLLEPGPVVLVTTSEKGRPNVMTMSWHTMMEFEPPLVGCVISDRNHSFGALKATRECVINIPTVELAAQVVGCGNTSGRRLDKFRRFGLTPVAGCAGQGAADRRMLCRTRMQARRREAGGQILLLHPRSAAGVDRPLAQGSAHDSSPRPGRLYGRRQNHQAAVENEIASCRPSAGPVSRRDARRAQVA